MKNLKFVFFLLFPALVIAALPVVAQNSVQEQIDRQTQQDILRRQILQEQTQSQILHELRKQNEREERKEREEQQKKDAEAVGKFLGKIFSGFEKAQARKEWEKRDKKNQAAKRVIEIHCGGDFFSGRAYPKSCGLSEMASEGDTARIKRIFAAAKTLSNTPLWEFSNAESILSDGLNGHLSDALSAAAYSGHINAVKFLIEEGADVDGPRILGDRKCRTPLDLAHRNGHTEIVQVLKAAGAKRRHELFPRRKLGGVTFPSPSCDNTFNWEERAARQAADDAVNALPAAEADVNVDKEESVSLSLATNRGERVAVNTPTVADVNETNQFGKTNLMRASEQGDGDAVNALLAAGANVNAVDKYGQTALARAARRGHSEVANALIAAEADVNAADEDGLTPLMRANNGEVANALIAAGANVNAADDRGRTALMWAAIWGNSEVVRALIAAGADVNAMDYYRQTVLNWAKNRGDDKIVNILKTAGAEK